MPKIKYDVSNVSSDTDVIVAGVYDAVITNVTYGKSKNDNNMFTLELEIRGDKHAGRKLWHYILPDQAEFRMREFTDALQLPANGTLDTDAIKGTMVQVRTVVQKSDEYGDQARVKNLLPSVATSDAEGEEAPYEEWEQSELADEIAARELEVTGRKTKAKMVAALEEDDAAAEGEGEAEEEEEEEGDGPEITAEDVQVMDRPDLKKLIKEEELEVKVTKGKSDDALREEIIAALELEAAEEEDEEEEEEDEEEEEEAEAAADFSDWDIADLKAELKERGLKPDGRKSVLIKRLEQDDASGSDPF